MSRPIRVLFLSSASVVIAALTAACGTEKITVPKSDPVAYSGAVLFSQRCSGCHTLAFAGTHGSASNVRTREISNGPNFDVRCERPVARVLYAIENGGFSGAIMPQNVVVGQDAREVAQFVATYAGRQAANQLGGIPCQKEPIGTLPSPTATTATAATTPAATATTSTTAGAPSKTKPAAATKRKPTSKPKKKG